MLHVRVCVCVYHSVAHSLLRSAVVTLIGLDCYSVALCGTTIGLCSAPSSLLSCGGSRSRQITCIPIRPFPHRAAVTTAHSSTLLSRSRSRDSRVALRMPTRTCTVHHSCGSRPAHSCTRAMNSAAKRHSAAPCQPSSQRFCFGWRLVSSPVSLSSSDAKLTCATADASYCRAGIRHQLPGDKLPHGELPQAQADRTQCMRGVAWASANTLRHSHCGTHTAVLCCKTRVAAEGSHRSSTQWMHSD